MQNLKFFKKTNKIYVDIKKVGPKKHYIQKINIKQIETNLFNLLLKFVFKNGSKKSNKILLLNS